jgi:hypothetical protein
MAGMRVIVLSAIQGVIDMPHIRTLFPQTAHFDAAQGQHVTVYNLLRENKNKFRQGFSIASKYPVDVIAVIPDMVPSALDPLSANLLPLELVIDAGTKCIGLCKEVAETFKHYLLVTIPAMQHLHFGIWLRAGAENHYTEHKPGF